MSIVALWPLLFLRLVALRSIIDCAEDGWNGSQFGAARTGKVVGQEAVEQTLATRNKVKWMKVIHVHSCSLAAPFSPAGRLKIHYRLCWRWLKWKPIRSSTYRQYPSLRPGGAGGAFLGISKVSQENKVKRVNVRYHHHFLKACRTKPGKFKHSGFLGWRQII